jgi:hypothetical protein
MKNHYSEADLLETYYMQPGESMPVMMHLANCGDCAARYERLEKKLHDAASCHTDIDDRPETFWSRQRHTIMHSIAARRVRGIAAVRTWRAAAAAILAFVLGGAVVYESIKPEAYVQRAELTERARSALDRSAQALADETILHDPWQSDQLRDFHGVVAWESWEDANPEGDMSL